MEPTRWTWVWATPRVGDGQGSLQRCSPWGRKELDMTEQLNWTESLTSPHQAWLLLHSTRALIRSPMASILLCQGSNLSAIWHNWLITPSLNHLHHVASRRARCLVPYFAGHSSSCLALGPASPLSMREYPAGLSLVSSLSSLVISFIRSTAPNTT